MGFPCGSAGKKSACNVGDLGLIPGLGRSPGEGNIYPLQYSGWTNSMDCIVPGVTKSWTRLSNFHFNDFSKSDLTDWLLDSIVGWLSLCFNLTAIEYKGIRLRVFL